MGIPRGFDDARRCPVRSELEGARAREARPCLRNHLRRDGVRPRARVGRLRQRVRTVVPVLPGPGRGVPVADHELAPGRPADPQVVHACLQRQGEEELRRQAAGKEAVVLGGDPGPGAVQQLASQVHLPRPGEAQQHRCRLGRLQPEVVDVLGGGGQDPVGLATQGQRPGVREPAALRHQFRVQRVRSRPGRRNLHVVVPGSQGAPQKELLAVGPVQGSPIIGGDHAARGVLQFPRGGQEAREVAGGVDEDVRGLAEREGEEVAVSAVCDGPDDWGARRDCGGGVPGVPVVGGGGRCGGGPLAVSRRADGANLHVVLGAVREADEGVRERPCARPDVFQHGPVGDVSLIGAGQDVPNVVGRNSGRSGAGGSRPAECQRAVSGRHRRRHRSAGRRGLRRDVARRRQGDKGSHRQRQQPPPDPPGHSHRSALSYRESGGMGRPTSVRLAATSWGWKFPPPPAPRGRSPTSGTGSLARSR